MTEPASAPSPADPNGPARVAITREDLTRAAAAGILDGAQAQALWGFLGGTAASLPEQARFSFGHTLYYFGGLLAIGAMSLFMTLSWDALGPWGICILSLLYGAGCWAMAETLRRRGFAIPAGLLGRWRCSSCRSPHGPHSTPSASGRRRRAPFPVDASTSTTNGWTRAG